MVLESLTFADLPYHQGFSVTVETAVVILGKLCAASKLTCEHSTRQWHTCQDTNLPLASGSEELCGRFWDIFAKIRTRRLSLHLTLLDSLCYHTREEVYK
jgi:hypothetical protein